MPSQIGMDILERKTFIEFTELLQAMRYFLVEERNEQLKKSIPPELSTD